MLSIIDGLRIMVRRIIGSKIRLTRCLVTESLLTRYIPSQPLTNKEVKMEH